MAVKNKKTKKDLLLVRVAKKLTSQTANSACVLLLHQPKLPKAAKKMRKF